MAKNRPTQRLQKGIREAVIFSQRKAGHQRFLFDTIVNREDSEDARKMLEDVASERLPGVRVKANYCQVGTESQTPPFNEWAKEAITRLEPGEKYLVLIKTDNSGKEVGKALFKNDNGVPVLSPLELKTDSEWELFVKSSARVKTGVIEVDETHNYETTQSFTEQGMPSVSQEILQPVNDTDVPTHKDVARNARRVERQVDTEIPTTRPNDVQKSVPQSHSGFSPEEMAAAEFGIAPEKELEPSNTSQIFREGVPASKSSDSTLMPEETDYSSDKTEKDSPVPPLSPSNTSVLFNNPPPVDDDFQLSDEEFDLSDEDSEHVLDLEGDLGDTKFLQRTDTGKLVKPDSNEKFLDSSAPSLSPSSDTEMIPALKPREPSMQETIKSHLDSLDKKEDGYFGRQGEVSDDLFVPPRSITREVEAPKTPANKNLRKDDIPFQSESSKVLGKSDIPKSSDELFDDFSDNMFSPPPADDVGEDTELNMEPVQSDEHVPGSKTEHLPPKPQEGYVLMNEVPPSRQASRAPPKLPVRGQSEKPAGVPVSKSQIEKAIEEHNKEEAKVHENKIAHVQKVIQAGKDNNLAFVYRDYPGTGEIGFFISSEFAEKMRDSRFAAPKSFLEVLDKAKITSDDFALTQVYAAGGSTYEAALKFSPESINEQIFSQWAHVYFLKIHNNPDISEEQKKNFVEITGISAFLEGAKAVPLSKNLKKSEKKVVNLQEEVNKYHKLGSYNELVMLSSGRRPSKIKRYAAVAVLALAAGVGGYFLNNSKAPASNSDLESKLAQVTTERDSANSKYEKLSKEYNSLVDSEKDLKQKVESLKNEKLAIEKKFESVVSKQDFDALSKQYESVKLEEEKVKAQLDNVQKEKSDLETRLANEQKSSKEKDALLESQKSEYESQLSQKDALLKELTEKYSSYVSKESLDEIVKKNSEYETQISQLTKELDGLKDLVKKYESLGKYEDVKALVDKQNKQQKVARNSDEVYKIFLGQLESYSVTNDEIYRHIACANLTKAAVRSGEEAQVWLAFMRLVDMYDSKDFGSTKEQSSLVAAKLMEAAAIDGKFDDLSVDAVVAKYKNLRGQKSDEKWYDKKCLSAAELAEQHFLSNSK